MGERWNARWASHNEYVCGLSTGEYLHPYPWVVFKNFLYRVYWALCTYVGATHLTFAKNTHLDWVIHVLYSDKKLRSI